MAPGWWGCHDCSPPFGGLVFGVTPRVRVYVLRKQTDMCCAKRTQNDNSSTQYVTTKITSRNNTNWILFPGRTSCTWMSPLRNEYTSPVSAAAATMHYHSFYSIIRQQPCTCSSSVGWDVSSPSPSAPNASIPWPIKFSSIPTPEQIRWGEREKLHRDPLTQWYSVEYKRARPLANWYNYRGEKRKWDKIPIKKFSGILHLHTLKLFSFNSLYWSNCFISFLLNSPLRIVDVEQKCTILSFQIPFIKGLECMCVQGGRKVWHLSGVSFFPGLSQKWRKTFLVTMYIGQFAFPRLSLLVKVD